MSLKKATKETLTPSPTLPLVPTKTEEEKEIIRKMKTWKVAITAEGFVPASLLIKPYDQVEWVNQTQEEHKIVGEGWQSPKIGPGKRFTQSFEKKGTYPFSCQYHPEEKGEIRVE